MANVNIDLKATDNTAAGFSSAAASAQRFASQMSQLNSRISQNWVANQQSAREIAAMNTQFYSQNQAARSASGGIASLTAGWKYLTGTILAAGTVRVARETYQLARLGAEASFTGQRFDRLARTIGTTGDAFLNDLRTATRGTISDFALMQQGTNLLNLDLASTRTEAVRLSRVMAGLGMDTGELTLALANQSTRRLDQLNISLDRFNKIKAEISSTTGLTGQALYKEAFLQSAEYGLDRMGSQADSQLGDYMRFEAQLQNAKVAVGGWLGRMLAEDNQRPGVIGSFADFQTQQSMQGTAEYNARQRTIFGGAGLFQGNRPGNDEARQSSYEAMARYYMAPERAAGGGGIEQYPVDYALLLEGSLKITAQTEKYRDASAGLNTELNEQIEHLRHLEKKYGVNSEKVREQKDAILATRDAMAQGRAAQTETGGGYVMQNLAGMEADPQTMLDFAMAAGMVTQEAYAAQSAYIAVATAINEGTMAAQSGALAAGAIASGLGRLDGERFTTFVDVIVNWIGQTSVFGGARGLNQANQAAVQNCFASGTLILMADGQTKPIQSVMVGDRVTSYDHASGKLISATVSETYHHTAEEAGEYYLIVNEIIHVTPNHPLFINGAWAEAGTLKFGDTLQTPDGTTSVRSLARIFRKIETYNLHIDDENHNYFADGILAHNKAQGGLVRAPGDGSKDTVMVPLANGEYVIRAQEAEKYMPLLEAINDGRFMFGMAGGGTVGGRAVSRTTGGGRGGSLSGRALSRSGAVRGTGLSGSGFDFGSAGDVGVIISEAAADIAPSVAAAVSQAVTQAVTANPQITAINQSIAVFEQMSETLELILAKTATEGGIGRAVNGDIARTA